MIRSIANIFSFLAALGICLSVSSFAKAQSRSDSLTKAVEAEMRLGDLISRFDDDADTTMKCSFAVQAFLTEFEKAPANPYTALYLARAYDKMASVGVCDAPNSLFLGYADSALVYFRLADRLQPGVKEKKFGFSIPEMVGHLFGSRCLWRLKNGDYENARKELMQGMKEGGYTPAQIELCRLMLDFCDTGSIFFPAGDDDTFPTMYLQMVDGYRTDVSAINSSMASMKWYFELFLSGNKKGFTPVEAALSQSELDSLEVAEARKTLPDRLYSDVDIETRSRIHNELGIDVADKTEMCFPVYQPYDKGYYTYGVHKAIASILLANKWKRRVFFGMGGLEGFLNCTHVAIREGGIVDELYPINVGQADHFKKGNNWFHDEKMKNIFLGDARMEKFSTDQICSNGQVMMYYALTKYLSSLDPTDVSRKKAIHNIQSIPHTCLEGAVKTVFACAELMFMAGFKEEAKAESRGLLPALEKNLSGSKSSMGQDEANYIIALIMSGDCDRAKKFINSFEISEESKTETLRQIRETYGCE